MSATAVSTDVLSNARQRLLAVLPIKQIIPAVLISCFLTLNYFFVPWAFKGANDWGASVVQGFLIGQFAAQLNLIAVWATLGNGSWLYRLPLLLLLTTIQWISYAAGSHLLWHQHFSIDIGDYCWVTLGAYLLLTVGLASVPWLIARYGFGWRLGSLDQQSSTESRFDLREMLGAFALLAAVMGLLRIAGHPERGRSLLWDHTDFMMYWSVYSRAALVNFLVVTPSIWAGLNWKVTPTKLAIYWGIGIAIVVYPETNVSTTPPVRFVRTLVASNFITTSSVLSLGLVSFSSFLWLRKSGLVLTTNS